MGKFSFYYWGCKVIVCSGAALLLIAVNLALLAIAGCPLTLIRQAILSAPQVVFSGGQRRFFLHDGSVGECRPLPPV